MNGWFLLELLVPPWAAPCEHVDPLMVKVHGCSLFSIHFSTARKQAAFSLSFSTSSQCPLITPIHISTFFPTLALKLPFTITLSPLRPLFNTFCTKLIFGHTIGIVSGSIHLYQTRPHTHNVQPDRYALFTHAPPTPNTVSPHFLNNDSYGQGFSLSALTPECT